MSHFFVNLDKPLYSFKKKSPLVSILLNLEARGTFKLVLTRLHPPRSSACCEGCEEKLHLQEMLGKYLAEKK